MTPNLAFVSSLAALASLLLSPVAARAQTAVEAGKFSDWSLNLATEANQKLCFAATLPRTKEPPGANRGKALLYISAWPKDGIKSEVSVKLGYKIKPDSEITVAVGDDTFKLFANDERAFVADATDELKLLEAMKKGSKLTVKATSARGTATTDTYSLSGLGQALQALAQRCP